MNTQFHDWTLVNVVFEWARASVVVALDGPSSRCVIFAEKVSLLEIPQEQPWGRSVSVNSFLIGDISDKNEQSLRIEMQSGDVIRINAKKFMVEEKP